jgi:hypothetical protein
MRSTPVWAGHSETGQRRHRAGKPDQASGLANEAGAAHAKVHDPLGGAGGGLAMSLGQG